MEESVHLTREGYQKFEAELHYLTTVRRSEVAERLRIALEEGGDLVENAEYVDAKDEQAFVEGRIQHLENLLSRAAIIEEEAEHQNLPDGVVTLNSLVKVQEAGEKPQTFHIVGSAEADPMAGRISDASPIGRALMGKKAGESITIDAPDGAFTYRIISISRS